MNVRRKSFLNEHCSICGGKIFRVLLGDRIAADDRGDEYCRTQLRDCCSDCECLVHSTDVVSWPCDQLEEVFDRWDRHELSRREFDGLVFDVLSLAGIKWCQRQA